MLSVEPESHYDRWSDAVIEAFTENFYERHQDWIYQNGGQFDGLLNRFWRDKAFPPQRVAAIIERLFKNKAISM